MRERLQFPRRGRLTRGVVAVTVVAVLGGGFAAGCVTDPNLTKQCDSISDNWERSKCKDDARRDGGETPEQLHNIYSPVGAQLIQDVLTTYAQGTPFPWEHYKIQGIEDRTTLGEFRDGGDTLNTVVFPQMAEQMVAPEGALTDKTNAVAHCVTALLLDDSRPADVNAAMEGSLFGALGSVASVVVYREARDHWVPEGFVKAADEEQAAIASGVEPLDAENSLYYATVRGICDDTLPFHGLGSIAKGWDGINPLKSTEDSRVLQICGESCQGGPSFFEGQGPPVPIITGLADGFVPTAYDNSTNEPMIHAGVLSSPMVVFARNEYSSSIENNVREVSA